MTDYRPKTNKIELHITYRCDLDCVSCSRGSFLRQPHTPDMTLDDARAAFAQCDALGWQPLVIIIGGEPTVHPKFLEFCRIAREWMTGQGRVGATSEVQVYSNGYRPRARALCEEARIAYDCSIFTGEWKPLGSRTGGEPGQSEWHLGMFVSPADAGLPWQGTCYCHSSEICGVGVDAYGYSACATALSVGALLGDEVAPCRTKNLADLFDLEKSAAMTRAMCEHCGYAVAKRKGHHDDRVRFAEYVKTCSIGQAGSPMSPTWAAAFKGRK